MNDLLRYSNQLSSQVQTQHTRYLMHTIEWQDRLIGITGARGTGKTTLMLQYIRQNFKHSEEALYISLDHFYFLQHSLFELAESFFQNGGKVLFIDEVHKYPNWSLEIKNIYDFFPSSRIVFSGSSALQLHKAHADLSRRAAMYHLHELSFREYLSLSQHTQWPVYSLEQILKEHVQLTAELTKDTPVLRYFKDYLVSGSYPFFMDTKGQFHHRLQNVVNVIIENDLFLIEHINAHTASRLKKLVSLIAESVPFKVNISELSRKAQLSRDVLLRMLDILERAQLINTIRQKGSPTGNFTKPDKLYLKNATLLHALSMDAQPTAGTVRETFFAHQLGKDYSVQSIPKGDFLIGDKYVFEIGGKNKTASQIKGLKNAYIAADQIEMGYRKTIPLWLFGFLY